MSNKQYKDLRTTINTLLPDNTAGNISAADVRDTLLDIVDSIIPIIGSGKKETPYFNGPSGIHFRDNDVTTNDTVYNYIYGTWDRNKVSGIGFGTGQDTTLKDDGTLCFYTAASGSYVGGYGLQKRMQIQPDGEIDVYASGIGNVSLNIQGLAPVRGHKKDPMLIMLEGSTNKIAAVSGEALTMGHWDKSFGTFSPSLTVHESGQIVIQREGAGVGLSFAPIISGVHYGWNELQLVNTHFMNLDNNQNHSIGSRILFKGHKNTWNHSYHPSGQAEGMFALGTDVHAANYNTVDKNNFFIQDVYTSGSPVRLFIDHWGNTGIDTVKPSGKMHIHTRGTELETVGINNPASGVVLTMSSENANTLFDVSIKENIGSVRATATFTVADTSLLNKEGWATATLTFDASDFDSSNNETITIIDHAGTSKTYTIKNDYGATGATEFNAGGSRGSAAENLAQIVAGSNGHNGTIFVKDSSGVKFSAGGYDFSDGKVVFQQAAFSAADETTISHSAGWDALTSTNAPNNFSRTNEIKLIDGHGGTVTFFSNHEVDYNASTATYIGTKLASSTSRVAEAIWRAIEAARIAGTLNVTTGINPGTTGSSSFLITQVRYGEAGNTGVTGALVTDSVITVSGFSGGITGNGDTLVFSTREPTHDRVFNIGSRGHIGLGTVTPVDMFHIRHSSTAPSGLTIDNEHGRTYSISSTHASSTVGSGQLIIQDRYGNNSPTRIAVGPSGNIGIGTNTMPVPGTATKALVFGDNAAHAKAFDGSSGNNTAGIYAKDTGGCVKLYAFDEGNNQTTLSPHVFKYFESPDPMAWSFYSRNDDVGEEINVDMFGAIRAIEKITGKKFIHKRKLNGD
jgi:hypothetical protein